MDLYTTREVQDRINNDQYRSADVEAAAEMGISYSSYVDLTYDPHKDGELGPDDEVRTGWEVVQDALGFTTEVNPAAGIWPIPCLDIWGNPAMELVYKELTLNTFRGVSYAPQMIAAARKTNRRERWERAGSINFLNDTSPGSPLTPYFDAIAHWDEDVAVDIAVEELTTRFEDTKKKDYRATIMEYDAEAFRIEETSPGSNPKVAKFDTTDWTIQPKKRRLGIPFTYDHLQDVEFLDKAMEHVEQIAVQSIMAKVDEGLEAMAYGAGSAPGDTDLGGNIIRLQDLDSSATDAFTPKAWLALQKKFPRTYILTSCLAPDDDITELQLQKIAGTNVMLMSMIERDRAAESGFGGGFEVMNQTSQGVRVGWHEWLVDRIEEKDSSDNHVAYHNAAIVYDKRKAIECVTKMNEDLQETTRDMLKQLEWILISETWGWISYQPKKAIYIVCMGNPASGNKLSIAA